MNQSTLTVQVTIQNSTKLSVLTDAEIATIALSLLAQRGLIGTWQIDCQFVSTTTIQKLNRQAQGYSEVTDVLSFPIHFATNEADPHTVFPAGNPQLLGGLVIAPSVAKRQASERGHTLHTELVELVTHGLHHLLGEDHNDQAQWLPRGNHHQFSPRTDVIHG